MTNEQEYKNYQDYCQAKYGSAYMSAMKKLSAPYTEAFDKDNCLKPDYVLTPFEKEALLTHIPEYIDNQRKGR